MLISISKTVKGGKSTNHTCDIDINCSESCKRNCSHVLRSDPERKKGCCLIVQRLRHQNGRRAIFTVGGEIETNWHVGFRNHPVLQVVCHPWVTQMRGCFDCLNRMRSYVMIFLG